MKTDKNLIKQRFEKSLSTYDDNALIQKEMAETLAKMINLKKCKSVLELGCGTGLLTKEIVRKVEFEEYDAIDIVGKCEKYISKISDRINFTVSDAEMVSGVNGTSSQKYDLIVSNASLQWVEKFEEFINRLQNSLNNNGIFAFTLFGKGNFKEFKDFVKNQPNYYSVDELKEICKKYKIISIKEEVRKLNFNTPVEVLHHVKNTGVNALENPKWTKSDLNDFIKKYPKCGDKYSLTYNPIYVVLKK